MTWDRESGSTQTISATYMITIGATIPHVREIVGAHTAAPAAHDVLSRD
jgi:hypothetical protein